MSEKVVIITGFGPFRNFAENPSSQIIDELGREGIEGVKLELHKISVVYDEVSKKVPELWAEHNPDLVIHMGAHEVHHTVKFEQQAFADGYCADDVNGCTPEGNQTGCCRVETILQSDIDCEKLAEEVNQKCAGFLKKDGCDEVDAIKVLKSEDPGRYLCGFSYFLSLHQNKAKSLFVHVPPFDSTCTLSDVTQIIRQSIKCILKLP